MKTICNIETGTVFMGTCTCEHNFNSDEDSMIAML